MSCFHAIVRGLLTLWISLSFFLAGGASLFKTTISQLRVGYDQGWGMPVLTHLRLSHELGTLELKGIGLDRTELRIAHATLHPHRFPDMSVTLKDIHASWNPTHLRGSWHDHPISLTALNLPKSKKAYAISIDHVDYLLFLDTQLLQLFAEGKTEPLVHYEKTENDLGGWLNLGILEGLSGHIQWQQTESGISVDAHKFENAWCTLDHASFFGSTTSSTWRAAVDHLRCLDGLVHVSTARAHQETDTEINIKSNLGTLHLQHHDHRWHNLSPSEWTLNTHCLRHREGHEVCLNPAPALPTLSLKGPFSLNSRAIPGILVHIDLQGHYDLTLDLKNAAHPIQMKLSKLSGDLDHLAHLFLMRVRYLFKDGSLNLSGTPSQIKGHGVLRSPQGDVSLALDWPSHDGAALVHLDSEQLRVTDQKNYLEGRTHLKLALASQSTLSGHVDITSGHLELKPILSVATLHDDVVISGDPIKPLFGINLKLALQNPITLHGMGLNGQLHGWLHILSDNQVEQSIHGSLRLHPAQFRVFGREILLDECQINWLNQAWAKASVNLLAHRKMHTAPGKNVQVDLKINGPLSQPQVHLSSNQTSMNELQMISHLFSRSVTSHPEEDRAIMEAVHGHTGQRALFTLLQMVDRIERGLGLDVFELGGLSTTHTANPAMHHVTVGKLLHPRIMLKYKMSLDSQAKNHITLDYNIMPHINLELDTDQQDAGLYLLYEH